MLHSEDIRRVRVWRVVVSELAVLVGFFLLESGARCSSTFSEEFSLFSDTPALLLEF